MNSQAYSDLHLNAGAGETEIKAAFRKLAKRHHPDTSSLGPADADNFRKAYQAYKQLLADTVCKKAVVGKTGLARSNVAKASARQAAPEPKAAPVSPTPFVFEARRDMGLDVYLDVALVRPSDSGEFVIIMPWSSREACPRCLGQGRTLGRLGAGGSVYRPQSCPKCHGTGSVASEKHVSVKITPEMAAAGKFRLRGLGLYLPKQARRGDLIVSLRWTDSLPKGH
jgi:DnaJ-class molecular chaperone